MFRLPRLAKNWTIFSFFFSWVELSVPVMSSCILARDAFVRTNRRATVMMFVRLSGTGVHCDHTVQLSVDLCLLLNSPMFWAPWHQSMSTYSQPSFPVPPGRKVGMDMFSVMSQERLRIEVKWAYCWVPIGSHICRVSWQRVALSEHICADLILVYK